MCCSSLTTVLTEESSDWKHFNYKMMVEMINNPPSPSPWRCVKETEPSTASVWGHLQQSWLLCDLLQHSPLPVPPLLPPGTCRGSTLGCCLLCGRRSALCELERRRGLFRGCLSRFSHHLDRRARREPTNVYEAAEAPLSLTITPFSLVEIMAVISDHL